MPEQFYKLSCELQESHILPVVDWLESRNVLNVVVTSPDGEVVPLAMLRRIMASAVVKPAPIAAPVAVPKEKPPKQPPAYTVQRRSPDGKKIEDVVFDVLQPGVEHKAEEFQEACAKHGFAASSASGVLSGLKDQGIVENPRRGLWRLATPKAKLSVIA
jgi:hypothetical protein